MRVAAMMLILAYLIISRFRDKIFIVKEWIQSEISSTKIRRAIRRKESVRYLLQDSVIEYIKTHRLYR